MQLKRIEVNRKTDSGSYLKLSDGESAIGTFRGEVYEKFVVWENGRSKQVSGSTSGAKSRYTANFICKDGDKYVAKIFEFSPSVYMQLHEINSEYPLETAKVKITRRGMNKETSYVIMPSPKGLSAQELAAIEAVPLQILNSKAETKAKPESASADPFMDDAPIFDDEKNSLPF